MGESGVSKISLSSLARLLDRLLAGQEPHANLIGHQSPLPGELDAVSRLSNEVVSTQKLQGLREEGSDVKVIVG